MYRTFLRNGDYIDSSAAPVIGDDVCAVVRLDILDYGDAYLALAHMLQLST